MSLPDPTNTLISILVKELSRQAEIDNAYLQFPLYRYDEDLEDDVEDTTKLAFDGVIDLEALAEELLKEK